MKVALAASSTLLGFDDQRRNHSFRHDLSYNSEELIISHAHGDHIGGAEVLQTRYGVRVVMGGADWDLAKYPNLYKTMAPNATSSPLMA